MKRALLFVLLIRILSACGNIETGAGDAGAGGAGGELGAGGCSGCLQDGRCQPGTTVDACGAAGGACEVCPFVCQSTDELGAQWCSNGAPGWAKAPICRRGRCDLEAAASCPAGCASSCSTSAGCGP